MVSWATSAVPLVVSSSHYICSFFLPLSSGPVLTCSQQRQIEEQKKKWAEEKAQRTYEGMFTDDLIEGAKDDWSDDDFM